MQVIRKSYYFSIKFNEKEAVFTHAVITGHKFTSSDPAVDRDPCEKLQIVYPFSLIPSLKSF